MKLVFLAGAILLLAIPFFEGERVFIILPQPIGVKQWIFIFAALFSLLSLLLLHFRKQGNQALYLFFLTYPFLAQSVFYLNIASPIFVLTPAFIFLSLHLFLSKEPVISRQLGLLFLFCISTLISVLIAANKSTALAFFVLAVGGFAISAYLMYARIVASVEPMQFIWKLSLAILIGSMIFFLVETIYFQITPSDIPNILLRRWSELPQGRYYTGGYREPAGLAFVFSLFFWVTLYYAQTKTKNKRLRWINRIALLTLIIILFITGTRSAILTMINTFVLLLLLTKTLKLTGLFKLKPRYTVAIVLLVGVSAYFLIPRTILTSRSRTPPSWIEPTHISFAGRSFQLVGTTADYYNRTLTSLNDFTHHPLGTGPLNAPIPETSSKGGLANYYSFISNLIVIGVTFGWISLVLWLIFLLSVTYDMFRLNKYLSKNQELYILGMVFLAILLASHLPGSMYLGPMLNWANFDYYTSISSQTVGLPADYPAIISGIIVGGLLGIMKKLNVTPQLPPDNSSIS